MDELFILTKLPPCTLLFRPARLLIFRDSLRIFVKYSVLIWNFLTKTRFIFWWQASVIMNKTASFHPALFLLFWAKFHPASLFRTARSFIFVKIPPCTLIRDSRVVGHNNRCHEVYKESPKMNLKFLHTIQGFSICSFLK